MKDVILAPDIYVNASVALGSPPEHVVRRTLGGNERPKTSTWILGKVEAMLRSIDSFKEDAVEPQMATIRQFVDVVDENEYGSDAWQEALLAAAKSSDATRVVTDHPDFADVAERDGILFVSSESFLVELTTPPPTPGG